MKTFNFFNKVLFYLLICVYKINAAEFVIISFPSNDSTITNNRITIAGVTNPGLEVLVTVRNSSETDIFTQSVPSDPTTGIWLASIASLRLASGRYRIIATTPGARAEATFLLADQPCTLLTDTLTLAIRRKYTR